MSLPAAVMLRYAVRGAPESWVLSEDPVPESILHDNVAEHLLLLLKAWAVRSGRNVWIARNLAVRWVEAAPRIGIDPDVCVLEPAPENPLGVTSLRLWEGHAAPPLCFEIVSPNHPHKDYGAVQDRYASLGAKELIVFDPLLSGPKSLGGPAALQVWRRDEMGIFERVHFGGEPGYSVVLGAWVHPVGQFLEIADDRGGTRFWQTAEQHERAEKEHERAEKERERAEKEREQRARMALEQRVAELEARATKA